MKDAVILLLCAVALADGFEIKAGVRTCNCNPSEAQQICEANFGNDNVVIAHENCDKFYLCTNGKPVAQNCPANLLYNPYLEQCDWPANVDCGDRPISDGNEEDDADCDDDDIPDKDSDSGDDNGNRPCNCNPGEAPSICAAEGSTGILIAHENCNQFYTCDQSRPVTMNCPPTLLYNPYTEECDWPQNVECGDRVIPEPENDDSFSEENGNDGSDNDGTCNCNPEEAPAICEASGSDGILVAHENCDQYYICNHGRPVATSCPSGLLFNPYTKECDWARNVDCGDRIVPDSGNGCSACNEGDDVENSTPPCDDENNEIGEIPPAGDDSDDDSDDIDDLPPQADSPGNDSGEVVVTPPSNNNPEDSGNDNNGTCNCNPGEAPSICQTDDSDGVLIAHENCNQFYKCANGKPVVISCPEDLLYNPYTEQCDWPQNVDCGDRVIPGPEDVDGDNENDDDSDEIDDIPPQADAPGNDNGEVVVTPPSNNNPEDSGNDNNGTCNCNPGEAPSICQADDSDGVLIAHENCNQFYKCANGKPVVLSCPGNLLYNPYTEQCDWPENVDCGDRVIPDPDDVVEDSGNDTNENEDDGDDNQSDNNGENDNGTCNCNPEEAPSVCAVEDSDGVLIAHENCNQFYQCDHGKPVVFDCPGDLLYNPYTQQCDWSENVECGDRVIPGPEDVDGDNENDDDSDEIDDIPPQADAPGNDNGEVVVTPPSNNNPEDSGNDNNGTCNCNPGEAPSICQADDSDGVLIAHENCNQFYTCANGKPVVLSCPGNLMYNPYTEQCDWPENVDCGDRVIPDPDDVVEDSGNDTNENEDDGDDNQSDNNGENDNSTCNCNPEEAPSVCAVEDSDGVLIAHENCNQFYQCDHGKPVVFDCPGDLLYNPYTQQCDWSENVECGDRVIPGPEDVDGDNENDDDSDEIDDIPPQADAPGNDNGEVVVTPPSNNNPEDSGNDNNGTCNCNPGEAPSICQADDSDGVLIAHENCNQFYTCANGKPVVLTCPGNLLYNPYTEQCDWPENVDCGDRVIPDPDDVVEDSGNDTNENEDDGDDNQSDNNGENDNSTCNCNPEEAPSVCAVEDSDGVLIAHENCNQFYQCDHGKPVVFDCPGDLLYNPYTQQCDWSENVECGDRVIPGPEDVDGDNGNDNDSDEIVDVPSQTDAPGSDSGEVVVTPPSNNNPNDSGNDNNGTCNCNPGEAQSICQADDSDGVLIAHENCNQFYKCDHGKPVVFDCYGDLLYNPYTEKCDWPENVDCGDRVVPDTEVDISATLPPTGDDSGNGNDDYDKNSSEEDLPPAGDDPGNDGANPDDSDCDETDDDNDTTCNCEPDEAPSICAADNSEDVLIAHEYCTHFYKCANGKPVAFKCDSNLLYNPIIQVCDWPYNVECGDRVIPDPVEDDNVSDSEEIDDNVNENENITCNCNPEEAPEICAVSGSDGIQIAHENCNKFYQCSFGRPQAISCPSNLLYNPYLQVCDWPANVDCGDRVIPDPEDNDKEDSEVDDNNDDGVNNVIYDDPSQAPEICAGNGSDGVLVAHENCNQFYMCSGGTPISLSCPGQLLFNPQINDCDWPNNVDCGNRIVSGNDNDCACNPRNAPTLCSRPDSDGKLVAHENCNQFFMCTNGVPVVRDCPANLLYNIEKEVCDWPQNVNCEMRTVSYTSLNKHLESRQALRK